MKYILCFIIISIFVICTEGCGGSGGQPLQKKICVGDSCMYLDTFAANLRQELNDSIVKYAFVVRYGIYEVSGSNGKKRTAADSPEQDFTVESRFNLASVSKTITALGVLQLLSRKNIGIEQKIFPYLPSSWSIPSTIQQISFRQLLRHESGIRDGAFNFSHADVKRIVEAGVNLADTAVSTYNNNNYALCRVLTAYLDGYVDSANADTAKDISYRYRSCLQKNIFSPLQINNVSFMPDPYDATLLYPFPPGSTKGDNLGDWRLIAGTAGIIISAHELADFMTSLRYGNTLLPDSMKTLMYNLDLGWDVRPAGVKWNYGGHNFNGKGGLLFGSNGSQINVWEQDFNNELQIVLAVNCNSGRNIDYIGRAYMRSWTKVK